MRSPRFKGEPGVEGTKRGHRSPRCAAWRAQFSVFLLRIPGGGTKASCTSPSSGCYSWAQAYTWLSGLNGVLGSEKELSKSQGWPQAVILLRQDPSALFGPVSPDPGTEARRELPKMWVEGTTQKWKLDWKALCQGSGGHMAGGKPLWVKKSPLWWVSRCQNGRLLSSREERRLATMTFPSLVSSSTEKAASGSLLIFQERPSGAVISARACCHDMLEGCRSHVQ